MKKHMKYYDWQETDQNILWFWEIFEDWDEEQKC